MAKFGEASRSGSKGWEVREMPESVPIRSDVRSEVLATLGNRAEQKMLKSLN